MSRAHGLAGVFVWEAGQDLPPSSKASLLSALALERRRMAGRRKPAGDAGRKALHRAAAKTRAEGGRRQRAAATSGGEGDSDSRRSGEL
jgi:hypothetical protein